MRSILLALSVLAMMTSAIQAQSYHPAVYLYGGRGTLLTPTSYPKGIYRYDATGVMPTITKVCDLPPYSTKNNSLCMDYDNQNYLMCMNSTYVPTPWSNAVVRYDVTLQAWSTVAAWPATGSPYPGPNSYTSPTANVLVDQNGDYLFSVLKYDRKTSPTTIHQAFSAIYRYDRVTRTVSTILLESQMNPPNQSYFLHLSKDIDTGRVLIADYLSVSFPIKMRYPVWTLNPEDGYNHANVGIWNDGSVYGWKPVYKGINQNVLNGFLERPYYRARDWYQLPPGSAGMKTSPVSTTHFPPGSGAFFSGKFDLQAAAKPRFLLNGNGTQGAWLYHYDVAGGWTMNTYDTLMDSNTHPHFSVFYNSQFEFDGGRHIQTVAAGKNRWHIFVDIPHLPGKAYLMAAGISGVRPGVRLPDGRTLNLVLDHVTIATLHGGLPGIWSSGSGYLNARGEAKGLLDLSGLPLPQNGYGHPLWIAVVVLDLQAPGGVAYLPDTYVMRL